MSVRDQTDEKMRYKHYRNADYGKILKNDIFGKSANKLIKTLNCSFRP